MKRYVSLRWILLGAGLIAIIGLTGMNVYSLYALHERTIDAERENKKNQLVEFTYDVRDRFYTAFYGLARLNTDQLDKSMRSTGRFPDNFKEIIKKGTTDSLYTGIYFTPEREHPCEGEGHILRFDVGLNRFATTDHFPELVCDGLGMARTRMKVLIDEYRWNNKLFFDTNRSMTIALINLYNHSVIGYLTFVVDQDYLVNRYMAPMLQKKFGDSKKSGVVVWLNDWTKDQVLASSDPSVDTTAIEPEIGQKFPDLLGNWNVQMAFIENPALAASKASLFRNLSVLGAAVILLLGTLGFMFFTAQRERELALRQAGFLANVTHELKTPLAVMQAAGENLADGRVRDTRRLQSYGEHIYNESLRLREMIDKLLDAAKTDAGLASAKAKPHKIDELVDAYLAENREYIEAKNFTIDYRVDDDIPFVMIDESHFSTVFSNLVENALKYSTDDLYLGLHVRHTDQKVQLHVIDHGIGIPKKSIKHVFEKFYRVDDSMTSQTKGHGLGLSIVKNLVELNGGEITIKSQAGMGTQFVLTFPAALQNEPPAASVNGRPETSAIKKDNAHYVG